MDGEIRSSALWNAAGEDDVTFRVPRVGTRPALASVVKIVRGKGEIRDVRTIDDAHIRGVEGGVTIQRTTDPRCLVRVSGSCVQAYTVHRCVRAVLKANQATNIRPTPPGKG